MKPIEAVFAVRAEYEDISGQVFIVTKWYDAKGIQVWTEITPKEKSK